MANKKVDIANNNHSYFYSLEFEEINCFKDIQTLDLSDNEGNYSPWTIILGDNGTGKTTLLKIISNPSIIPNGEKHKIFLNQNQPLNILTSKNGIYKDSSNVWYTLIDKENHKKQISFLSDYESNIKKLTFNVDINTLFILSYGASRRMSKTPIFQNNSFNEEKLSSLFNESIELINVEEWYLQKFLATKTSEKSIKNKLERQLDLIKIILIDFLPDVIGLRIKEVKNLDEKSSLEVKINSKEWIDLRDLSFGYQTTTALLVDIASKMMEQYPESKNPLAEPVIILIDEIDLHLHPKWQRTVIEKLSHHFPKAQFIVTAHSPLIVQAAEDINANIVVCRKEGDRVVIDNNPDNVKGWRIDQILTSDLFEVESPRSKVTQENVDEYINLKGKEKLTESDKNRIKILGPLVEKSYNQNTLNTTELDKKLHDFAEKFLK